MIVLYGIIGAGGFLGSWLIKKILENTDEEVIAAGRENKFFGKENKRVIPFSGDLRDSLYRKELTAVLNRKENLKIIYLAAVHNIDAVAEDPSAAYFFNISVLKEIVEKLNEQHKIFFASSDTVYGEGGEHFFKENEQLNPVSLYGEQKIQGEKIIESVSGTSLRLPLMFSHSVSPYKKHFCDNIVQSLSKGETVKLFTDSVRSTLDYGTAAQIILKLSAIKDKLPAVINIAGDVPISKYDLGIMLAEKYNFPKSLIVPEISEGKFIKGAQRAKSTLMDNGLVKGLINEKNIQIKL